MLSLRQRGFSLIELMIAMVLGLLLTVVLSQLFITSKRNFSSTDDTARMQENIRFATQMLMRHVRLAGYRNDATIAPATTFPPGTDSAGLFGTEGGAGPPIPSDSIKIRFQGSGSGTSSARASMATAYMTADDTNADGLVVDCRGYKVHSSLIALNEYSIATGANGSNALFCNGSELVSDVDSMQIIYGVDTDTPTQENTYGPNYYVSASGVTNMDLVTAVKIALLFRSPNPTSDVTISKSYNLLGTTIPSFGDMRSRRVASVTINLRNRPLKE